MKHALILISLLMTIEAYADYNDQWKSDSAQLTTQIPTAMYNVTNKEIVSAVVEVILRYNWIIESHTKNSLIASYKRNFRVEIKIEDDRVTISEIPVPQEFQAKWMESLHKYIEVKIQYYHYVRAMADG